MEKQTTGSVLVVGGGIAGIQASLDLADSGYRVVLAEHSSAIGGVMSQLDKTFPTNDCAMCIISPKLVEAGRHLNIDLYTMTDVQSIDGDAGNFTVTLRQRPRFIDMEQLHSLRRMQQGLPRRGVQRLRPGPGQPQGRFQALSPGHAQRLYHREKRHGPLQGRLSGQPQFPGLHRPDDPG